MEKFVCETPPEWSEDTVVVRARPASSTRFGSTRRSAASSRPSLGRRTTASSPTFSGRSRRRSRTSSARRRVSWPRLASEGGGGGGGENGTFVVALHVRNGRDFRSKKLDRRRVGPPRRLRRRAADGARGTSAACATWSRPVTRTCSCGQASPRNALGADVVRVFAPALGSGCSDGLVSQVGLRRGLQARALDVRADSCFDLLSVLLPSSAPSC